MEKKRRLNKGIWTEISKEQNEVDLVQNGSSKRDLGTTTRVKVNAIPFAFKRRLSNG